MQPDKCDISARNPAWRAFLSSPEAQRKPKPRLLYAFIIPGMIYGYILGARGGWVVCDLAGCAGLLIGAVLFVCYRMRILRRRFRAYLDSQPEK